MDASHCKLSTIGAHPSLGGRALHNPVNVHIVDSFRPTPLRRDPQGLASGTRHECNNFQSPQLTPRTHYVGGGNRMLGSDQQLLRGMMTNESPLTTLGRRSGGKGGGGNGAPLRATQWLARCIEAKMIVGSSPWWTWANRMTAR